MSKVVRTGTIYRMVGFLVVAVIALAIAVPQMADMLLSQAKEQDAEVAARPLAAQPAAPIAAPKPVAPPQAPVVFGAPTMPATPVDYAKLQQQNPQNTPAPIAPTSAPSTPSYQPTESVASEELGIDPQITAPRVIPPPAAPKPVEKPRNWQRSTIQ